MRDFVIATESNADLPAEFVKEHGICVIPHYYTVEEEVYGDGKFLTAKEFYDAMRAEKPAATMASNPTVIEEMFTRHMKEGRDILFISFSSELSAGFNNIVMTSRVVMEAYPERTIEVVDTRSATLGEMMMITKAVELRRAGQTLTQTKAVLEELIPHLCLLFTVDDLNHLYRGGRLSKPAAVVGSLIDVKPILHINAEGKLVALQKTRGRKKSINTLVSSMEERLGAWRDKQIFIGVMHGDSEEDAEYLKQQIKEKMGYENIIVSAIGPSIGAHSGPGALGLAFLGEYR
ncbi:MAG: DegV family protein [Lachnospiraceae bacterium]|jgi:DegV family protein with EDD domain|nr:DegV family protein [Lachnospiraceae bacterium]